MIMGFNIFMNRQQVVEKYGIPLGLEAEVFAVLKPASGSGTTAQYLQSRVDQQLEKYFSSKHRLRCSDGLFYPMEKKEMAQSWADTVADDDDEGTALAALEPLLVDEKQAAKMLGVSRRKIFELNKAGVLPSRTIGSRKLYSVKKLREFADGEVV